MLSRDAGRRCTDGGTEDHFWSSVPLPYRRRADQGQGGTGVSHVMTSGQIQAYEHTLRMEELSGSTIGKYVRAVRELYGSLPEDKIVTRERVLAWKERMAEGRAASTVNVMIAAVDRFFAAQGWEDLHVKRLKAQRRIWRDPGRELTKAEYLRLLGAAQASGDERMFYLMQALASTGIRVSELRSVTVEALRGGTAVVDCKGKQRRVLIPRRLRRELLAWCEREQIVSGPVFVTRSGRPMDRSNIWRAMRRLCPAARVEPGKVFPHNLRHLFAVTYYRQEKDVAKLADLLGHASIDTTRIYIMESGAEHERQIERLGLFFQDVPRNDGSVVVPFVPPRPWAPYKM